MQQTRAVHPALSGLKAGRQAGRQADRKSDEYFKVHEVLKNFLMHISAVWRDF